MTTLFLCIIFVCIIHICKLYNTTKYRSIPYNKNVLKYKNDKICETKKVKAKIRKRSKRKIQNDYFLPLDKLLINQL